MLYISYERTCHGGCVTQGAKAAGECAGVAAGVAAVLPEGARGAGRGVGRVALWATVRGHGHQPSGKK